MDIFHPNVSFRSATRFFARAKKGFFCQCLHLEIHMAEIFKKSSMSFQTNVLQDPTISCVISLEIGTYTKNGNFGAFFFKHCQRTVRINNVPTILWLMNDKESFCARQKCHYLYSEFA